MLPVGKKQKKTTAAASLSEDILAEILKRLPVESLHRLKCVQKSWYQLVHSPYFKALHYSHNHRILYMLVSAHSGFVLYKIDPLHYLRYNSDSTNLHDLLPLLVFPANSHIGCKAFKCIKLGSKIYMFGLNNKYFSPSNTQKIDYLSVYTIDERDLMNIKPSEGNTIIKFKHILRKTKNPMHSSKSLPTPFVANDKLYVFCNSSGLFEVFSPVDKTWQVLPPPADDAMDSSGFKVSYFVVVEKEQMVYFATSVSLASYNLKTHKWSIHGKTPASFRQNGYHSTCVPIIGEMAFGFLESSGVNYICASKTFSRGEELLQPYLAPDKAFLDVLRSSRFSCMQDRLYSDYIVVLQDAVGTQVPCIVTYGNIALENGCPVDKSTSYVALSFFDIPGGFYTSKDRPVQEDDLYAYADEKAEDGGVVRRYFNAKFRYTKHFATGNSDIMSKIVTCFF